jgi:hypothetical protein
MSNTSLSPDPNVQGVAELLKEYTQKLTHANERYLDVLVAQAGLPWQEERGNLSFARDSLQGVRPVVQAELAVIVEIVRRLLPPARELLDHASQLLDHGHFTTLGEITLRLRLAEFEVVYRFWASAFEKVVGK